MSECMHDCIVLLLLMLSMIIQVRARTSAGFGDYSSPVDYSGRVRNIGIQYSRCLILHSLMQIHLPLLHQPRVHPHHPVPVKAVLRSHAHLHPPAPHQSLVLWSHVLHLPAPLKVTTCIQVQLVCILIMIPCPYS